MRAAKPFPPGRRESRGFPPERGRPSGGARAGLLLVLALLTALALLAWGLLGGGAGTTATRSAAPPVPKGAGPKGAGEGPALADVPVLGPASSAGALATRAAVPALPAEEALWIDGWLELPPGTPADEEVRVFAASLAPGAPWRELECERNGDGRFRAPVARGATRALLRIEARYLFLRNLAEIDLERGEARIAPELGAWLAGSLAAPGGVAVPSSTARAFTLAGGARAVGEAEVRPDGSFDLFGLPAGTPLLLTADVPGLAGLAERLQLAPGEHDRESFALARGAVLEGRVEGAGGQPLAGAEVEASSHGLPPGVGLERRAVTGPDGSFVLTAVAAGPASLVASKEGLRPAALEGLELADGERASGLVLRLEQGRSLSGRVQWPDGAPAAGALVVVVDRSGSSAASGWREQTASEHATDAEGGFAVAGLGAGPYQVRAEAVPTGSPAAEPWRASAEVAALGGEVTLVLAPPLELAGRATDDLGRPLARFTVEAEGRSGAVRTGEPLRQVVEREDGTFRLAGLGPGRYSIVAEAEGHARAELELDLDPASPPEPCLLVLARAASVSGFVVGPDGAPRAGATVGPLRIGGAPPDGSLATRTGPEGAFLLEGLTPGSVLLSAELEDLARSEAAALELAPGELVAGVTLVLRNGGRLSGEVYGPDGRPEAGRQVAVRDLALRTVETAETDAGGRFAVEPLAPGTQHVMVLPSARAGASNEPRLAVAEVVAGAEVHVVLGTPPGSEVRLSGRVLRAGAGVPGARVSALLAGTPVAGQVPRPTTGGTGDFELALARAGEYVVVVATGLGNAQFELSVPPGAETRVELALPGGGIAGRVLGPDGTPVAGVSVSHQEAVRGSVLALAPTAVVTDAEGRFALGGLAPGTYSVRARPPEGSELGTCLRGGVVVAEGETTSVELELARGGRIVGAVWSEAGTPVSGATIFVRDESGVLLETFSHTESGADGRFVVEGCPAGALSVLAREGPRVSTESPVHLAPEGEALVDLVIQPGTLLEVEGLDPEGRSVPVQVSVRDEAGREQATVLDRGSLERLIALGVSARGHSIGPLPAGRYSVLATASDGSAGERTVDLGPAAGGELRVVVTLARNP